MARAVPQCGKTAGSRPDVEAGHAKVSIEGQRDPAAFRLHDREAHGVRIRERLIGEPFEKA